MPPTRSFLPVIAALLVLLLPAQPLHAEPPPAFPVQGVIPGMALPDALAALDSAGLDPETDSFDMQATDGTVVTLDYLVAGDEIEPGREGFSLFAQASPAAIGHQIVSIQYERQTTAPPDIAALIAERDAVYGPGQTFRTEGRTQTTWSLATDGTPIDVFDYRCGGAPIALITAMDDPALLFDAGCAVTHALNISQEDGLHVIREYLAMPAFSYSESLELTEALR